MNRGAYRPWAKARPKLGAWLDHMRKRTCTSLHRSSGAQALFVRCMTAKDLLLRLHTATGIRGELDIDAKPESILLTKLGSVLISRSARPANTHAASYPGLMWGPFVVTARWTAHMRLRESFAANHRTRSTKIDQPGRWPHYSACLAMHVQGWVSPM